MSVTAVKDRICIHKEIFSNVTFDNIRPMRIRSQNKRNIFIDFKEFIKDVDSAITVKSNVITYIKGKILGLKRSKAKVFAKIAKDYKFEYYLVQDLVVDLLKVKLNNPNWLAESNSNSFHSYLVIDFTHKYIDTINIPFLINNPELVSSFPIKETYPKISFKYSQTLGSMVFNYTKFSKEIVIDNIDQYHCECEQSDFNDDFHNHIATGNLDVLGDQSLIDNFKFGSKFRVIPKFNVNNIITTINNNVDE